MNHETKQQDIPITMSGIADEASDGIDGQISAHQALGWETIELRLVEGKTVTHDLPDDAFDRICDRLSHAGLRVTAFASAIGNWSRPIGGDFAVDMEELKTAATRMGRLGVRYIRTMSWTGQGVHDADWRRETMRRYKELVRIAADHDIVLAHENCAGWAGQSQRHMRQLIEETNSDHLAVLFDIGNTISHGYEPWPFYTGVKDLIGYVHIKDCRRNPAGGRSQDYAYPGQGDAQASRILTDLFAGGYRGVTSIEPHVAKIVHDPSVAPDPARMYESYLHYARQAEALVQDAWHHAVPTAEAGSTVEATA